MLGTKSNMLFGLTLEGTPEDIYIYDKNTLSELPSTTSSNSFKLSFVTTNTLEEGKRRVGDIEIEEMSLVEKGWSLGVDGAIVYSFESSEKAQEVGTKYLVTGEITDHHVFVPFTSTANAISINQALFSFYTTGIIGGPIVLQDEMCTEPTGCTCIPTGTTIGENIICDGGLVESTLAGQGCTSEIGCHCEVTDTNINIGEVCTDTPIVADLVETLLVDNFTETGEIINPELVYVSPQALFEGDVGTPIQVTLSTSACSGVWITSDRLADILSGDVGICTDSSEIYVYESEELTFRVIRSAQDGWWTSVNTWSPAVIPGPQHLVFINHNVGFSNNTVTINSLRIGIDGRLYPANHNTGHLIVNTGVANYGLMQTTRTVPCNTLAGICSSIMRYTIKKDLRLGSRYSLDCYTNNTCTYASHLGRINFTHREDLNAYQKADKNRLVLGDVHSEEDFILRLEGGASNFGFNASVVSPRLLVTGGYVRDCSHEGVGPNCLGNSPDLSPYEFSEVNIYMDRNIATTEIIFEDILDSIGEIHTASSTVYLKGMNGINMGVKGSPYLKHPDKEFFIHSLMGRGDFIFYDETPQQSFRNLLRTNGRINVGNVATSSLYSNAAGVIQETNIYTSDLGINVFGTIGPITMYTRIEGDVYVTTLDPTTFNRGENQYLPTLANNNFLVAWNGNNSNLYGEGTLYLDKEVKINGGSGPNTQYYVNKDIVITPNGMISNRPHSVGNNGHLHLYGYVTNNGHLRSYSWRSYCTWQGHAICFNTATETGRIRFLFYGGVTQNGHLGQALNQWYISYGPVTIGPNATNSGNNSHIYIVE